MPNEDLKRLMAKETTAQKPAENTGAKPANEAAGVTDKANTGDEAANKFKIKLKVGGEERELTDDQIASTFERYANLNYKHAQYKPALDLVEQLSQKSGADPATVTQFLVQALSKGGAQQQAPTKQQQQAPDEDEDAALAKWEQENAASLPPGFRDMRKGIKSVAESQAQLMAMLTEVMQSSKGVADAAKVAQQDARQQTITSIKRTIGTNLSAAQQKLGLPNEAAKDFMMFAAERGFSMEDFIDPQLTLKVATDFKNAMNTPDFERLKQVAARRQAFTGSIGTAPSAGPSTGGDAPKDAIFDRLMAKRMG